MQYKKFSVVVPAYNEAETIEKIIDTLLKIPLTMDREIIVVEDGSTDNTADVLQKYAKTPQIKLIFNDTNIGKTPSVKKGVLATTGDIVVIQDADLEYNPTNLPKMLNYFKYTNADVVYGNRFNVKNADKGPNYLGNLFLTTISNTFTRKYDFAVNDMETCYKMAKGQIFRGLAQTLETNRFGLEPEITAKFARLGLTVENVDIDYSPRSDKQGKKLKPIYDGLKALSQIVKFNTGPELRFLYNLLKI